jgi:ribosome-associated heat shock protein Hsp15
MAADRPDPDRVRLDVWLDVACLYRTRSEAQKACKGGKVGLNGHAAKPHREVGVGDEIRISRAMGRRQTVIVRRVADRHLPKAAARELYEDVTPPVTAEELERRRLTHLAGPGLHRGRWSPDKRERRLLRRMKRGDG